jgi:hypothetical protein
MHHKNIKLIVRKQLKKQYPDWNRLSRKEKKEIAQNVRLNIISKPQQSDLKIETDLLYSSVPWLSISSFVVLATPREWTFMRNAPWRVPTIPI